MPERLMRAAPTDVSPLSSAPAGSAADDRPTPGALDGIRVLEIGSLIAGPFAGRLLGDYGADVIKVEDPHNPDPLRSWGQVRTGGRGLFWTIHARNKRCITLDLRVPAGQAIFEELARTVDVVVENFRPGTLERWSLGFDRLHELNPQLILARISGYGQTGPMADRPGYASVAEAMAGLRYITGHPGQAPVRTALSLGDSVGGMFAVQGILAALLARGRSGTGQVVDVALTDSCLALTESMIPDYDRAGLIREPGGTRLPGIAPSNAYKAADGAWVIIAANQDSLFRRLCHAMERDELADDPRFATHGARADNEDELDEILADWALRHTGDDIERLLTDAGVAAGPICTVADVVRNEQFRARHMLLPHFDAGRGTSVLGPGVTPQLSETPGRLRWAGPERPGLHNAEVYRELLGYDERRLGDLAQAGVV
jgi:formyl-CoA transferase